MSYCRWGRDSDVYVFTMGDGLIVCCGCSLHGPVPREAGPNDAVHTSAKAMLGHLLQHRELGHVVPEYALDRLRREADEQKP